MRCVVDRNGRRAIMALVAAVMGLSAALAPSVVGGTLGATCAGRHAADEFRLAVTLDREPIGSHSVCFSCQGDLLVVDAQSDITVKRFFVTVHRHHYRSREIWQNGKLLEVDTDLVENGKRSSHQVRRDPISGRLRGLSDGFAGGGFSGELLGSGDRPPAGPLRIDQRQGPRRHARGFARGDHRHHERSSRGEGLSPRRRAEDRAVVRRGRALGEDALSPDGHDAVIEFTRQ